MTPGMLVPGRDGHSALGDCRHRARGLGGDRRVVRLAERGVQRRHVHGGPAGAAPQRGRARVGSPGDRRGPSTGVLRVRLTQRDGAVALEVDGAGRSVVRTLPAMIRN